MIRVYIGYGGVFISVIQCSVCIYCVYMISRWYIKNKSFSILSTLQINFIE